MALPTTAPSTGRRQVARSLAGDRDEAGDAQLAAAAAGGDQAAFGTLVARYAGPARRVAMSILGNEFDADDAAQDGFVSAWRHLGSFQPGRPFRPWLMRIVANAARDLYRRRKVRSGPALPDSAPDLAPGPEQQTEASLLGATLSAALSRLPERQRVAVTMFDAEGYSHREIAQVLGIPVGTVRSLVFHGRRALREALAPYRERNV